MVPALYYTPLSSALKKWLSIVKCCSICNPPTTRDTEKKKKKERSGRLCGRKCIQRRKILLFWISEWHCEELDTNFSYIAGNHSSSSPICLWKADSLYKDDIISCLVYHFNALSIGLSGACSFHSASSRANMTAWQSACLVLPEQLPLSLWNFLHRASIYLFALFSFYFFFFFESKGVHLKDLTNNSLTSKMTMTVSVFKAADCPMAKAEAAAPLHRESTAIFSPLRCPGTPVPFIIPRIKSLLLLTPQSQTKHTLHAKSMSPLETLQIGVKLPSALLAPSATSQGGSRAPWCHPQAQWPRHPRWLCLGTEKGLHVFFIPPPDFLKSISQMY